MDFLFHLSLNKHLKVTDFHFADCVQFWEIETYKNNNVPCCPIDLFFFPTSRNLRLNLCLLYNVLFLVVVLMGLNTYIYPPWDEIKAKEDARYLYL